MIVVDRVLDYETILYDDRGPSMESDLFLMFAYDENEAYSIIDPLKEEGITLAFILLKDWQESMVPWESEAVKGKTKAEGLSKDIPSLLSAISLLCARKVKRRFIVGYSLGGLFAAWESLSGEFDGFASVSGSMWYPGIHEWVSSKPVPSRLGKAYFSIGNKEGGKPSSPSMKPMQKARRWPNYLMEKALKRNSN